MYMCVNYELPIFHFFPDEIYPTSIYTVYFQDPVKWFLYVPIFQGAAEFTLTLQVSKIELISLSEGSQRVNSLSND